MMKLPEPPSHVCIASPVDPLWLRALIAALAGVPLLCSALRGVLIQHADLGDRGAQLLAEQLPRLSAVTSLELVDCMVGPAGAAHLATLMLPHASGFRLRALRLDHNPLGDAGCAALAKGLARAATITRLGLAHCDVGPAGARALAAALTVPIPAEPVKKKAKKRAGAGAAAGKKAPLRPGTTSAGDSAAAAAAASASSAAAAALALPKHEAEAAAAAAAEAAAAAAAARAAAKALERPALAPPMFLDLEGNPLGREGAGAVLYAAGDAAAQRVSGINVSATSLASGGQSEQDLTAVVALIHALRLSPTLSDVRLGGNAVGDAGLKLLCDNVLELTHVVAIDVDAKGAHGPALAARLAGWAARNAAAAAKKKKKGKKVVSKGAAGGGNRVSAR